jgi:hypothetical protein
VKARRLASRFAATPCKICGLRYSGMKLGPGGAVGLERGLVFTQASKATLNSVLNLRTYSAANSSRPSFLAWIHVLYGS